MWMIIFFVLPIVGLGYALWHIWQVLPFSNIWRWTIVGICIALFLSMFLVFSGVIEKMPLDLASITYEIGTSGIFVLLYLVMLFLLLDMGRLVHLIPKSWLFSNSYTSIGILAVMLAIFGYGNIHYYNKVREAIDIKTDKSISLSNDSLPNTSAKKQSIKIVLMSDLHLGYHNRKAEFKRWVDMINAEHPDLILIGGDIIDISVRPLLEENVAEEFHRLKAPIYACLGNHEYYNGEPKAQQFYKDAGIHLLRDSIVRIGNQNDENGKMGNLIIIGRDDRSNPHRKSIKQILSESKEDKSYIDNNQQVLNIDPKKDFTILLDHQPYHLEETEKNGIDFQFSGHTHHGQVWPISWITDAIYEDAFGPLQKGKTQYYVSSGMGIWGGKFRIGTRSEYVVLTIQ